MRRLAGTLLLALSAGPVATAAADLPDPRRSDLSPSQRLEALLEQVRTEQRKLVTLEAAFTQLKESALLVEPSEARGVFSYQAPDRVRWEYQAPDPISLLISGEVMITWYRDLDRAERADVGRHSRRILEYLGAGSSLDELLEYFNVSLTLARGQDEPYRLDLEPRFARVAKRLAGMSLWIHSRTFMPVRLRYEEADGDVTDYRFHDLRINSKLPADRFDLELPVSVDVRRVAFDHRAGSR